MHGHHLSLSVGTLITVAVATGCGEQRETVAESETAVVTEMAAPVDLKAPASSFGKIMGSVLFEGAPPEPQKLLVVKDADVCGKQPLFEARLVVGRDRGIQNAVISILDIQPGENFESGEEPVVLAQTGCEYQPHVSVVPVNTPLQVLNDEGLLHNIHTYSTKNRAVNIAQPAFKKKVELRFSEPEAVSVRCDIHGWMSAWIIVSEHPYYAVTDAEGRFTLEKVPPGTYRIQCWQELLGEQTREVTVVGGKTTSLEFEYRE